MKLKLFFIISIFSMMNAFGQNKPEDNILFNAFKQGQVSGGGNCASIALIKVAIGTYGVGNIFSYSVSPNNNSIIVKLKNDTTVEVLYSEIEQATKENGFVIKSEKPEAKRIKSYADTCFAVMVKMNEKINEYTSYKEALESLLDGYTTPVVYELLGLKFKAIDTDFATLRANTNVIFYNSYHAVYSSYGYYDETRSSSGYSLNENFRKNRFGIKCSWYLCYPKNAYVLE